MSDKPTEITWEESKAVAELLRELGIFLDVSRSAYDPKDLIEFSLRTTASRTFCEVLNNQLIIPETAKTVAQDLLQLTIDHCNASIEALEELVDE